MTTKEEVKKKIDRLSEIELKQVNSYLSQLKSKATAASKLPSINLAGKLDDTDLRSLANE
ncbi:MAG: hypothetical protein AAGC88_11900 [Bacteroidota bacterium]